MSNVSVSSLICRSRLEYAFNGYDGPENPPLLNSADLTHKAFIPDKQRGQGLDKDPEVKPQAPVLHIPHVIVDPAAYALGIGRLPAGAIDLSPPSDAGFDIATPSILGDRCVKEDIVSLGVRSRSDQGHLAIEDVEKLGQLVDAAPAKPAPQPGDPVVIDHGLLNETAIFENGHGTKL